MTRSPVVDALTSEMLALNVQIERLIVDAAELYYLETFAPLMRKSGVSDDGIAALARYYREAVADSREAQITIMRWLSEKAHGQTGGVG